MTSTIVVRVVIPSVQRFLPSINMSLTAIPARRRATRACDQCRRTKSRCDNPGQSDKPCRNCVLSATECTYLQPCHKRGPPKGYLNALEQRLHESEGLLGAIISSNDSRAVSLVSDLSKDPLAKSIIRCVANSSYGPIGRNARPNTCPKVLRHHPSNLREQSVNEQEAPYLDRNGHLVFTAPSNTWQDYLNLRLSLEMKSRCQVSSNGPAVAASAPPPHSTLLSHYAFPSPPAEGMLPSSESATNVDSYASPIPPKKTPMHGNSSDVKETEDAASHSSSHSRQLDLSSNESDYLDYSTESSYGQSSLLHSSGVERATNFMDTSFGTMKI